LSNWLREHCWIFKQGRTNLAYQPRIDAGLMEHKVTPVKVNGKDGVMFEKRHDDVLRLIRSRLLDAGPWGLLNFKESSYVNAQSKVQPMFEMTRDGYAFIVGKLSSKLAAHHQIAYIEAFNAMAAHIKNQRVGLRYRCMEKELEAKDSMRRGSLHGRGLGLWV